jgi:hypothetical protein
MNSRARLCMLRAASWMAPRLLRADWLAEWTAELQYVESVSPRATEFCLGAFYDVWWLRRQTFNPAIRQLLRLETPLQCLGVLAVMASILAAFAFHSPGARNALTAPPYRDPRSLVALTAGASRLGAASIPPDQYQRLSAGSHRWFTATAYYQPAPFRIESAGRTIRIPGALASEGLFNLLGLQVNHVAGKAGLVLTESARRHLSGRVTSLNGHPIDVVAVIADDAWRLPGDIQAWLLLPEADLAALPSSSQGFAVARSRPPVPDREFWSFSVPSGDIQEHFECVEIFHPPTALSALAFLFLTCAALLGTTTLSLGEYPGRRRVPWTLRPRRWIFLGAKIILVLAILIFGGLDQVAAVGVPIPQMGVVAFILGFRWVLIDQRRRCPICLRVLSNPVRIGRPSQTFLEWYGTELICVEGHGLLHVSAVSTSCYSPQRWTSLDGSWRTLFSEPAGHSLVR